MDHHTIAAVSVAGICLDVLGGLYLAYDLLGGQYGPLRLLTRMVTYSIVFGIGYALGMGLFFGAVAGAATGITVAIEIQRTGRKGDHYPLPLEIGFSAIRALGFGLGLYPMLGVVFVSTFTFLLTVGQAVAYLRGVRPGMNYAASRRPRFTREQFWGTVVRTVGYIAAALIAGAVAKDVDYIWSFAIRVGLVTGLVTAAGTTVNPFVEYFADNLPERRLGVFGIFLVLCGFVLQSVQYWVVILDIPVS
jgi:hypothetical protein